MDQFPTEKELASIYQDKGREVLVWYAWRCVLRILPLLGLSPQRKSSNGDVAKYYSLVSILLVISQKWSAGGVKLRDISDLDIYYFDPTVTISPFREDIYANAMRLEGLATRIISILRTLVLRRKNEEGLISDVQEIQDLTLKVHVYVSYLYGCSVDLSDETASEEIRENVHALKMALEGAAKKDLAATNSLEWKENLPVWQEAEPEFLSDVRKRFFEKLVNLGIGFLGEDLSVLCQGGDLGSHAKHYLEDWSDTIVSDSKLLTRVIIFGDPAERIHAVRVLLLGSGGAGKSSLSDRLQKKPVQKSKSVTIGIDYLKHQPLNLQEIFPDFELNANGLDLYLWDFGGQTIFHGLHRAFLHENCVYVLVVDSRHEQAPDDWLYQIRHLAGSQARVLLVTNWYEKCETQQNQTRLLREFPDLLTKDSFFYFSCLDGNDLGFKTFVKSLVKSSFESQRMILKETLDIQRKLERQYQDTVFLHERYLKKLIGEDTNQDDTGVSTISQLNQLGFLVRVISGKNQYCLKPSWAVDNSYQMLYSDILRKKGGVADMSVLESVLEDRVGVDINDVSLLVEFLKERALCCDLGNSKYFFPDAAPANEPLCIEGLLGESQKLTLRFDLPYLPLGFHARLVHELFKPNSLGYINTTDEIWRQGFVLRTNTSSAVAQYLLRKSTIELVLVGPEIRDYSHILNVFYTHLNSVVGNGNRIKAHEINPSVLFGNGQLFSLHSNAGLIDVLKTVKDFETLILEVGKMAGKINIQNSTINNSQVASDNSKNHSDNVTTQITADQHQIINAVLDEMLEHKLPKDVTRAVVRVQDVIEADLEEPTEKSQSLLSRVTTEVKQIAGFTDDATKIGKFVAEHKDEVAAVLTSIQNSIL